MKKNNVIKTVNLNEETDLSLECLDSRMEFLAGMPLAAEECGTYCIIKG